jgi:hypothetical protein
MHYNGQAIKPVATSLPALAVGLNAVTGSAAGQLWIVGAAGTIINANYDSPIRTYTDPRMEMSCGFLPSIT